jgi:flagellar biosynthesis protein FliQ
MPFYISLLQSALSTCIGAIAPLILILLVIGIATAVFQSAFQIEDATFALLLKNLATILLILFAGAAMLAQFEVLAASWISHAPLSIARSWH